MLLESSLTFFLANEKTLKRILKTKSELSLNRAEKEIMLSKTVANWLLNDI